MNLKPGGRNQDIKSDIYRKSNCTDHIGFCMPFKMHKIIFLPAIIANSFRFKPVGYIFSFVCIAYSNKRNRNNFLRQIE